MKEQDVEEKSFLDIDINQLDVEWLKQPKLYERYAERLADAKRDLEIAKSELEVTRAELDQDIRDRPDAYDLGKVTEPAIANVILTEKEYRRSRKKVIECKHFVDVLDAMVTALDHRKKALENLVFLHGQSYFASPRASAEQHGEMEEMRKRSVRSKGTRK